MRGLLLLVDPLRQNRAQLAVLHRVRITLNDRHTDFGLAEAEHLRDFGNGDRKARIGSWQFELAGSGHGIYTGQISADD